MAKKEKKISINKLEEGLSNLNRQKTQTFDWHGNEVTVKYRLSFSEMVEFVESVASMCWSHSGEYLPEVKNFFFNCALMERFANFSLPSNIEKRYELVSAFDGWDGILERIDEDQYDEIRDGIEEKIEYEKQNRAGSAAKQVNEVYAVLSNLSDKFGSLMNGVTDEDIHNVISTLGSGAIDEEKMLKAYTELMYGNADDDSVQESGVDHVDEGFDKDEDAEE